MSDRYDPAQAACAVTLPSIDHLAPILLMRDGSFTVARDLTGPEQHACRAWIDDAGDQFRRQNSDLLDQEKNA
ncbi:hypothetical protein [Gordonia alkaliphila]|uniref:Uncharacterized protein n=1 Tax=Gordonia alkaliphila TaxID=1053547 RepID=A0ABP8ZGJ3_9ACTN